MAIETERKFLVTSDDWKEHATSFRFIDQGYLFAEPSKAARVRISEFANVECFVTLKFSAGPMSSHEFEYAVPEADARTMMELAGDARVSKTRYEMLFDGRIWEIDVFHGKLEGLVLAEIEAEDAADVNNLPNWVGTEVTSDPRYKNAVLATLNQRP